MALTADHLIVVGRGRLIADMSVADFLRHASGNVVRVRSPQAEDLRRARSRPGCQRRAVEPGLLEVTGLTAAQIGDAAAETGSSCTS